MTAKAILEDYHIHTIHSGHSAPDMTVANIVRRAESLGMKSIAITEHSFTWNLGPAGNAQLIKEELKAANPGLAVCVGMEICPDPKRPGHLIYEDFDKGELLPVLTGLHSYTVLGYESGWNQKLNLDASDKRRICKAWFKTMEGLVAHPLVDVLAHPGRILTQNGILREFGKTFLRDLADLFDAAKERGVAVEMNENAFVRFPTERLRESYLDVFRLALDKGLKISFGSDAHEPDRIGDFKLLPAAIKAIGLKSRDRYRPKAAKSRV